MVEEYVGTKFSSLIIYNMPLEPTDELLEMASWAKRLQEAGIAPKYKSVSIKGSYGNLGLNSDNFNGIVVTPSICWLSKIKPGEFCEVLSWSRFKNKKPTVISNGTKPPSSESIMYCKAFEVVNEKAICHGHDKAVSDAYELGLLSFPITAQHYDYGTIKLAEAVASIIASGNYILIKDHHDTGFHGILSIGRTTKEAGERALRVHEEALKILEDIKKHRGK